MIYHEMLSQLFREFRFTAQDLAAASGISASSLSRYRQGKSLPEPEVSRRIAEGILSLIESRGAALTDAQKDELRSRLTVQKLEFAFTRFDTLLKVMQIQIKDFAPFVQFMPSYISKIRTGERTPADPGRFVEGISSYLLQTYRTDEDLQLLRELTGCTGWEDLPFALRQWLLGTNSPQKDGMGKLLQQLDRFDLNEYMTLFRFDALEVPPPQPIPEFHEDYYGLERIRQSHLDFFRLTVQSDSMLPIFMHNDMPMTEMAQDQAWDKAWMTAIALCLKKGLQLRIVHNVGRPVNEMLLGLEAWVPLYMTGLIEPYYFPAGNSEVYCHANFISGAAYLSGESVTGFWQDAWHELDTTYTKLAAAQKKAKALLKKAAPLMEIYNASKAVLYQQSLESRLRDRGEATVIQPTLPLHSMPEGMLEGILKRHRVPPAQAEKILQFAAAQQERFTAALTADPVTEVLSELTEAQFTVRPLRVNLTDCFCELPLTYTYLEYCRHLEALRGISHPNYRLLLGEKPILQNTQITLKAGKWAVFSKGNSPITHFVIRHPKMLLAVASFIRDITEG